MNEAQDSSQSLAFLVRNLEVGGVERSALRLALRARDDGWTSHLFCFDPPSRKGSQMLDPRGLPWSFEKRGRGLDLSFCLRLARWLDQKEIQVVHAFNDTALVYAGLAKRFTKKVSPRCFATLHNRPVHSGFLHRYLCRTLAASLDGVFVVSEALKNILLHRAWLFDCEVIPNGVDLDLFTPLKDEEEIEQWKKKFDLPSQGFFVGNVGRFHPGKRQKDLLLALKKLRGLPVILLFAGQGPDPEFAAGLRLFGNEKRIRVFPHLECMPQFYQSLDLLVHCSEEEAAPMVLLEAMASGLPIIATDIEAHAELLGFGSDDACAYPVGVGCPDEIAWAIEDLFKHPERRYELGQKACKRASLYSHELEWASYSKRYLEGSG